MDNNVVAAEVGDDIQLFCNSTGYPLPNITWRRVSRSMPPLDDIGKFLNDIH